MTARRLFVCGLAVAAMRILTLVGVTVLLGSLAFSVEVRAQGPASQVHFKNHSSLVQPAACVAKGIGCSTDDECCSHRCIQMGDRGRRCVGKRDIIRH